MLIKKTYHQYLNLNLQTIDMYPSDGIHTEKFIPSSQMVDCNFFTRLGTDWEQASKYFPFRKISIRTGMPHVV